jgi:hypothetical protein
LCATNISAKGRWHNVIALDDTNNYMSSLDDNRNNNTPPQARKYQAKATWVIVEGLHNWFDPKVP